MTSLDPTFFDNVALTRTGWARVVNINVPDKDKETELQKEQIKKLFTDDEWHSMDVLDVCCGVGRLTGWLDSISAQAWGIDWSTEMLKAARAANPLVQFFEGDVTSPDTLLGFSTNVTFTWCAFIHLLDDAGWRVAVENMKRWARGSVLYCDKVNDNATVPYVKVRSERTIIQQMTLGGTFELVKQARWHSAPEDDFVLLRFDRIERRKRARMAAKVEYAQVPA